jgi:hypothetical protein
MRAMNSAEASGIEQDLTLTLAGTSVADAPVGVAAARAATSTGAIRSLRRMLEENRSETPELRSFCR